MAVQAVTGLSRRRAAIGFWAAARLGAKGEVLFAARFIYLPPQWSPWADEPPGRSVRSDRMPIVSGAFF
jgi:hypothetical protein